MGHDSVHTVTVFIQASLSKIRDYPTLFKDLKIRKNPDLSDKILLQKY